MFLELNCCCGAAHRHLVLEISFRMKKKRLVKKTANGNKKLFLHWRALNSRGYIISLRWLRAETASFDVHNSSE